MNDSVGISVLNTPLDPAGRVLLGAARGVGRVAFEAVTFALLNTATLGGYATFKLYAGMWAGYNEKAADGTTMGAVDAINAVNPLYGIGRGGAETYLAIARRDYEAVGEKGVVTAIITAVTVAGIIQGSLAGREDFVGVLDEGALRGHKARAPRPLRDIQHLCCWGSS